MNQKMQLLLVGAGAVIVTAYLARQKIGQIAEAVNPLNNENVISEGANSALGLSAKGSSIGSFIFDLFNPEFDPNA